MFLLERAFEATVRSESLLERALVATGRSKSLLDRAFKATVRSESLLELAFEATVRSKSLLELLIFSSESLRCFDLSIRIDCAQFWLTHLTFGGTALLRPVLCTIPQAP